MEAVAMCVFQDSQGLGASSAASSAGRGQIEGLKTLLAVIKENLYYSENVKSLLKDISELKFFNF